MGELSPRQAVESHIRFLSRFGMELKPGARVLDFGCGTGGGVAALLEMGYDAFGVDIAEWWNPRHNPSLGEAAAPSAAIHPRLKRIDGADYRIPFPDESFDFCFSDQVFEHVFDYVACFREIGRVLKPGAVSTHRFPGPNGPIEGHTNLPVPWLCYAKPYLILWAVLGRRSAANEGYGWRAALASNLELMRGCNYPTKRRLRRWAAAAGIELAFLEKDELRLRDFGRAALLSRQLRRFGLERPATALLALFTQRFMMLRRVGGPPPIAAAADR